MKHLSLLALLWIIWCGLHSWLITPGVTAALRARLGRRFASFRLIYNIVALVTLIPVLLYQRSLASAPWFVFDGAWSLARFALLLGAGLLFWLGARSYDLRVFLGLRRVRPRPDGGERPGGGTLATTGILGVTRHPWYLGALLALWAQDLDPATLVANGVLSVYLVIGTLLEERKLIAEHGDEYRRYRERVSMLIPFKAIRRKSS